MPHRLRNAALVLLGVAVFAPRGAWAAPPTAPVGLSSQVASRAAVVSAPSIEAPATVSASSDQAITITATATDPDAGDLLTISAMGYPASLTLNHVPSVSPATASLTGTLGLADVGSFTINWSVSDGTGGTASTSTSLTVAQNQPPVVQAPATWAGAQTVPLSFNVIVSDPDGDPINTLTASPLPAGATFTVNALHTNGLLEWTPPLGSQGTYTINFNATSGTPARTSMATTVLTIGPVDHPPVITSPGTVNATATYPMSFTITVSDPDGDPVTRFEVEGTQNTALPAGAVVTFNANLTSATFSWTPTAAQVGNYGIDETVVTGFIQVVKVTRVVVRADRAPTVTAPASVPGTENVALTFTVSAADPDANPIASLAGAPLPSGATFSSNAAHTSGTFAWTPDYSQAGTYPVVFTATNNLSGSATTTITVANVDRAPLVTAPGTAGGPEGTLIQFNVTAADPDADPIASLTAMGLPPGATFLPTPDYTSGTFNWTPSFSQAGSYAVAFTASNALSGSAATTINVTDQNRAPVANAGGPYSGVAGIPVAFDGSASSDPDGDALTYAWDFGDGMSSTGAMPTHTYAAGGTFTVSLTVTDDGTPPLSNTATATAKIVASFDARIFTTNANRTIKLNSGKPRWCAQVEPIAGDFSINDIDASTVVLKYGASQIPAEAVGKGFASGDADDNHVPDLTVCFSKASLRTLFAGLPNGQNHVTVTIEGALIDGARISGSLAIDVFGSGAALAATVTPNPLNPEAVLSFKTVKTGSLQVRLYDVNGRLVRTLLDEATSAAGYHDIRVNGRGAHGESLPSGTYFYRIVGADGASTGRLTILK